VDQLLSLTHRAAFHPEDKSRPKSHAAAHRASLFDPAPDSTAHATLSDRDTRFDATCKSIPAQPPRPQKNRHKAGFLWRPDAHTAHRPG
jgi:hypothetical protein